MGRRHTPESFWERVDVRSDDECWPWTGSLTRGPHGQPTYGSLGYQGESWVAHRLAWTLTHGPIPDGLDVLHRCDFPPCCNVNKCLFLGTHSDNMIDRRDKGRHTRYPEQDPVTGRWLAAT